MFLGVEMSVTGRRWIGLDLHQDKVARAIQQQNGLPDIVCRILARLEVKINEAADYLEPSLRDLMPNPSILRDMDVGVACINRAVNERQRIAIFADYDVDGAASAALLYCWLRDIGQEATIYVPDRITEGYGPNITAMQRLAQTHNLIICVDCGTSAHKAIAAAKAFNSVNVIILDHHIGGKIFPPADAIINPNRHDESGALGYLCAGGVVFLVLVALNRLRRSMGQSCPDLLSFLDLVALATVADVVPLIAFNRALVRRGLQVLRRRTRVGLRELMKITKTSELLDAENIAYNLTPCINAGGRIGNASLGVNLLITTNLHLAQALAEKLYDLNVARREIEMNMCFSAFEQAEQRGFNMPLIWVAAEGWHPGVIGIVAARLKRRSYRPAVVIAVNNGQGNGSGRSVAGIDLGAAIVTCVKEGLLSKGGGHKMAAGFTINAEMLQPFVKRLSILLSHQGADKLTIPDLQIDAIMTVGAATPKLIKQVERAGPFGSGSAHPRYVFANMRIRSVRRVGKDKAHLQLVLRDDSNRRIKAILFNAFDTDIGKTLKKHGGCAFHCAGRLQVDNWNGVQSVKLHLDDIAQVV